MQQVPLNQIIFLFYWITTLRPPLPLEPLGSKQCAAVIDKARKKAFKGFEFAKLQMLSAFGNGDCQSRISSPLQKIKELQSNEGSFEDGIREANLQSELSNWLFRSKIMWRQKSRELRLKEGDTNSTLFHLSTIIHWSVTSFRIKSR